MADQELPYDQPKTITGSDDAGPPTKETSGAIITYTDSERRSVVRKYVQALFYSTLEPH